MESNGVVGSAGWRGAGEPNVFAVMDFGLRQNDSVGLKRILMDSGRLKSQNDKAKKGTGCDIESDGGGKPYHFPAEGLETHTHIILYIAVCCSEPPEWIHSLSRHATRVCNLRNDGGALNLVVWDNRGL